MQTLSDIPSLRRTLAQWRARGESIALVPTMGNLHAGHLSLVDLAAREAARVVVSIYVNPMQFDREDEVARYPRSFEADREWLAARQVDLLFCPSSETIYPRGIERSARVELPRLTGILCGAHRPGHFTGVMTVVTKLFNLVQPDVAVFGTKDYQQLQVIRRVTADLDIPVRVLGAATVREPDGLAMSSRNAYLTADERPRAPLLHQSLCDVAASLQAGRRDFAALEQAASSQLAANGFRPEYVRVLNRDLDEPEGAPLAELVVLAAAWLGDARLIDNLPVADLAAATAGRAVR